MKFTLQYFSGKNTASPSQHRHCFNKINLTKDIILGIQCFCTVATRYTTVSLGKDAAPCLGTHTCQQQQTLPNLLMGCSGFKPMAS